MWRRVRIQRIASCARHCEERSDEAIHSSFTRRDGLLRFARNDAKHTFATSRREAPEALHEILRPIEGVGNAGCPLHPQPRVRFALVESTRVNEYTGITRRSRTQW